MIVCASSEQRASSARIDRFHETHKAPAEKRFPDWGLDRSVGRVGLEPTTYGLKVCLSLLSALTGHAHP